MPRPAGSGKPKGYKAPHTRTKEHAREHARVLILAELEPLIQAQITAAKGVDHFILRDKKTGKFERVTEPARIVLALNDDDAEEGSTFYIHTKDPSTQAFTDLMNRALDKPKEAEQDIRLSGDADLIAALLVGRQRARSR